VASPRLAWAHWLSACEAAIAAASGQPPAVAGLLRGLVLAARDLAGPTWLAASGDDPDVAAFTTLQATPPPEAAEIDKISPGCCGHGTPPTARPGTEPPATVHGPGSQHAARYPAARKENPAMHAELAAERYGFSCPHCGARWISDYDVQHVTSHDGGTWQYYSLNGTPVPPPPATAA
jgi:hypothetical protein